jgi:hypothetical protein
MNDVSIKEIYDLDSEFYYLNKANVFSDKEIINDEQLKNIKEANWFKSMEHYPKTVGHIKLLISIVDKTGIFNKFDLTKTSDMDADKLDVLYAILRIMNKVFNKYLNYVVKKIFIDNLKDIFICSHLTYYDLFFDQLTQDIDHFICSIIKLHYPVMNEDTIRARFADYLKMTFERMFYRNIIKKLGYDVNDNFYKENEKLLSSMTQDFIIYTKETLSETYETMKIFLDKIFSNNCSKETTNEIITALKKHINLKNLFKEACMEIDIYCEQKLDDEFECYDSEFIDNTFLVNNKKLSANLNNIGYQIFNEKLSESVMGVFHPFVEHNLVKTKKDMFDILLNIFTDYSKEPQLMDPNSNITLEDYYALTMAMQKSHFPTYDDYCDELINTCQIPIYYPLDVILRLISRVFSVRIELYYEDLHMIEIDNSLINKTNKPIILYRHGPTLYYNLYHIDHEFIPICAKPKSVNEILDDFKKLVKNFKNNDSLLNSIPSYRTHKEIINV